MPAAKKQGAMVRQMRYLFPRQKTVVVVSWKQEKKKFFRGKGDDRMFRSKVGID